MPERRRADRVPVMSVTEISGAEARVEVLLLDISATGVRFSSAAPFALDLAIRLRIEYSPLDFHLRGLVVWSRLESDGRWTHGAEFVNVPDYLQTILADHLGALQAATKVV